MPKHSLPAQSKPMFEAELDAIRNALMAASNAQWVPDEGDPRNLDPDDEPLDDMNSACYALEDAVEALRAAVREELRERHRKVDEMSDEDYAKWEASIA